MTIDFVDGTLRIAVGISLALSWGKDIIDMRDGYVNTVYDIFFKYNKKKKEVEYSGMSGGMYTGPIPWVFK